MITQILNEILTWLGGMTALVAAVSVLWICVFGRTAGRSERGHN